MFAKCYASVESKSLPSYSFIKRMLFPIAYSDYLEVLLVTKVTYFYFQNAKTLTSEERKARRKQTSECTQDACSDNKRNGSDTAIDINWMTNALDVIS